MKIRSIKDRIKLWNEYNNPLYHWWKVKKYFKRPKAHLYIGKKIWFFGLPCKDEYYNSILDITSSAVGWKDKYNSPRHEWDPYIAITLFRKWQILWIFNWGKDSLKNISTWEALLTYLYYRRSLSRSIMDNEWRNQSGELISPKDNLKLRF